MDLIRKYEYIAIDFDGTLCEDKFPEIGNPNNTVVEYIIRQAQGGAKIILHTCRENESERQYLDEAVEWCKTHEIPISAVNENPFIPFGKRKPYADIYIDDRAINAADIKDI